MLKFLANSIKDNINKEWLEQYKYKYQFICFNDYFYKICKVQNNSFPRMKKSRDCLPLPTSSSHSRLCNTRGCIHVRIQTPRSGYKCGSTCLEALRCALIRHRVNEVVDLHPVPNERVPGRESSGRKVRRQGIREGSATQCRRILPLLLRNFVQKKCCTRCFSIPMYNNREIVSEIVSNVWTCVISLNFTQISIVVQSCLFYL